MSDDKCWCGGDARASDVGTGRVWCLASKHHDPYDRGPTGPVKTLYISGPMTGHPECNYPAFNSMEEDLRSLGYKVLNPAKTAAGASYRAIMKGDIRDLMECDGLALLDGWWTSRGANVEVAVAGILQMQIRPAHEWVDMAMDLGGPPGLCSSCGLAEPIKGWLVCTPCMVKRVTL